MNKNLLISSSSFASYAIGIVLFYPKKNLLKRVEQMLELGFKVYIFDNSPFDSEYDYSTWRHHNIFYQTAGKNIGIGFSLAAICATAYSHGHQRLLFLDQDTGISRQTLKFIENYVNNLSVDIQGQYVALVFNGNEADNHYIQDVRLAIGSGSLFSLPLLKVVGWHNEKYFVDGVDYELCLRARQYGLKVGLIQNTPDFDHVSEQPDRSISIMGKPVLVRRYSTTRIKDALYAYLKLIIRCLFKNNLMDSIILIKSAAIYLGNQLVARLIKARE